MTTKLKILEMGLRLWRVDPAFVTTRRIERELNMPHNTIRHHFGTVQQLKDAIAYHAVEQGEARVIVHLIAMQHKAVAGLDDRQRLEHMQAARACG